MVIPLFGRGASDRTPACAAQTRQPGMILTIRESESDRIKNHVYKRYGRPVGGFVNSNIKTALFWVVLIGIAVLLFAVVRTGQGRKERTLTFTEFLDKVQRRPGQGRHHQRQ